ncbi:MAG: helix-turn-helix domain-containing protein [Oscillospiraceae bacterium]|nr:helix-turn-helix domain-containing protein [Oscillospiraceae bacterium]
MADLTFKSSLSEEEIDNNFKDMDFFGELMDSLTEALAHSKGQAAAATFTRKRSLPDVDVSRTRKTLHMTQKGFADVLGVSCRTVEAWESGRSSPTPTAKKLIYLIDQDNTLVQKLMQA